MNTTEPAWFAWDIMEIKLREPCLSSQLNFYVSDCTDKFTTLRSKNTRFHENKKKLKQLCQQKNQMLPQCRRQPLTYSAEWWDRWGGWYLLLECTHRSGSCYQDSAPVLGTDTRRCPVCKQKIIYTHNSLILNQDFREIWNRFLNCAFSVLHPVTSSR